MRCPVCKQECDSEIVCGNCGFDQLQIEFLNREEAAHWLNNVVVPYREKWQQSLIATTVNWSEILLRQKEIRYFFDVTIPAAISKGESLGHTLLICPYKRLQECFVEQLMLHFPDRNVKQENDTQRMTMGDFAAALSNLQPGDICRLDPKALPTNRQYTNDIIAAFKEFVIIVRIGKGSSAQTVRLDLPPFTWLATVDSATDVSDYLRSAFENIIEIKVDDQEICKLEVASFASDLDLCINQNAIDLIASTAEYRPNVATNYLKRIKDYMLVKDTHQKTVTVEMAKEILSLFV